MTYIMREVDYQKLNGLAGHALGQNRGDGFFILQYHTHAVDEPFSPWDIGEFARMDVALGEMPYYLVTPNKIYSARRDGGSYRIDHHEDLPLLIPEDDAAAAVIRRTEHLVSRELRLL